MESYKVFMSESAVRDLNSLSSYIAFDLKDPSAAKKLVKKIKDVILSLDKLPLRHNLVSDEYFAAQGLRKILVDNYVIFYIVAEKDKNVTIVRILYGRRDWLNLL